MLLNRHPPPPREDRAKARPSKARPRICWMPCLCVPNKCWRCSMASGFLLPTIRPSGTCAGPKCSKKSLALFAVQQGSVLFATFAVIFPPCRSRGILCCLHSPLCSMVNLYRSLGHLSSYSYPFSYHRMPMPTYAFTQAAETRKLFVEKARNSTKGSSEEFEGKTL